MAPVNGGRLPAGGSVGTPLAPARASPRFLRPARGLCTMRTAVVSPSASSDEEFSRDGTASDKPKVSPAMFAGRAAAAPTALYATKSTNYR